MKFKFRGCLIYLTTVLLLILKMFKALVSRIKRSKAAAI